MHNHRILWHRAAVIQAMRCFFVDSGYLEVDTPVRIPCLLPEAHIEPEISETWFLQTSPEMCMKRLLASGFNRIFQICKCFRKNERGDRHLPEFTMLEWYRTHNNYNDMMDECQELILFLQEKIGLNPVLKVGENSIALHEPWEKISVAEAFQQYSPVSLEDTMEKNMFEETYCTCVEPHLGLARPLFLYDYPASLGSLARLKDNEPLVAERFELYIGGLEIANGFSELTNVQEQRRRFKEDLSLMKSVGRNYGIMPEKFLSDLDHMPEAGGIALGVDRLVMILGGESTIDEVVTFTPEDL